MDTKPSDTELAAIKCIKRGEDKLAITFLINEGWSELNAYTFVQNKVKELNTKGGEENDSLT